MAWCAGEHASARRATSTRPSRSMGVAALSVRDADEVCRCRDAARRRRRSACRTRSCGWLRRRSCSRIGHVLVRGGVEHDLGPRPIEHGVDHRRVADVAEHDLSRARRVSAACRGGGSRRGRGARGAPDRTAATWRAISEPIHPPPPVTSTRRPWSSSRTGSKSMVTCSRPRRSSMARSWTSRRRGMPCAHDVDDRRTRTGMFVASATSATCRTRLGGASVMAKRIWLIPCSCTISVEPFASRSRWARRGSFGAAARDRRRPRRPQPARASASAASPGSAAAPLVPAPITATRVPPPRKPARRYANNRDWNRSMPNRNAATTRAHDQERHGDALRTPGERGEEHGARAPRRPASTRTASSMLAWRQVRP